MIAAKIAAALGGAYRSGGWWRCRCPVHASQGATLALRDGDRALIVKCWAGCDPRDVLAELRRRGLIGGDAANDPVRPPSPAIDPCDREGEARKTAAARRIWDAAGEATGSPVAAYLRARQITIAPPATLRYKSLPSRLCPRITEPAKTKKQATSSKPIPKQNRGPFIHVVGGTSTRCQCGSRAALGCQGP